MRTPNSSGASAMSNAGSRSRGARPSRRRSRRWMRGGRRARDETAPSDEDAPSLFAPRPSPSSSGTIHSLTPTVPSYLGGSKPALGEKNMRLSRSLIGVVGVLGVVATASAAPPPWSNARHYRGPSHAEYQYARVVHVDPIVRQVRVESPRRECWDETRYVD